ncbi:hypothetical protein JP0129_11740 [Helicobacter pylori]|nr:hypothetical protein JP0129_11740 [Helicobacter pylori]
MKRGTSIFWIPLNTEKTATCFLEKFLEHYPYFGLRGKEDENSWNKAFDLSEKVYEHHFKTKLYDKVSAMSCGRHGGPCACWSNSDSKNSMPQSCKSQACWGNSQSA